MQTLMAERNGQLPADRIMQFRMGVHMGDVIADEDEVFGDDVNIAVRLESVAAPGGVAVSAKAYREAGKHLSATLVECRQPSPEEHRGTGRCLDLGAGRVRARGAMIPETHRTCRPSIGPRSSACFPSPILADSTDEYFADGLTEDLIHALSLQSFYRVLSRSSTFALQGQESHRAPDRARDRRDLSDPGLGAARRQQDPRHRRTDRAREWRATMDRPL